MLINESSYMRESKLRGVVMSYEDRILAVELPTIVPGLVTQIYDSVRSFKKGS